MAEFSDAQALAQLAKGGTDLSQPQRLRFLLRFESDEDAAIAVAQLDELAFASTIEPDDSGDTWAVLAVKTMVPAATDLMQLGEKLEVVAMQNRGTYEGWQAAPR